MNVSILIFSSYLRICLLIWNRERERETLMWERNIDHLPPIFTPTRDPTHSPLVYGMMLQPNEPSFQGWMLTFLLKQPKEKFSCTHLLLGPYWNERPGKPELWKWPLLCGKVAFVQSYTWACFCQVCCWACASGFPILYLPATNWVVCLASSSHMLPEI